MSGENMDNLIQNLDDVLKWGFINREKVALDKHKPKLLVNNKTTNDYVLTPILEELEYCNSFIISVAFITEGGLATLKSHLWDLRLKGVKGQVLTSTYLYFNNPKVFRELLKIENIEVRLTNMKGFHAKGYVFKHNSYSTIIMGSSNLTSTALKTNYEWNVKLTSHEDGAIIDQFYNQFAQLWISSTLLTVEWIIEYEVAYNLNNKAPDKIRNILPNEVIDYIENSEQFQTIQPNKMQLSALNNITDLRATGASKGLIISATGTGKTYLSAFDVKNFAPKRMLFIVHREQILHKAMSDYKKIIGGKSEDYAILSGSIEKSCVKYLFATIQTMSKTKCLDNYLPEEFDYILIDEVHKAGAQSYLKMLNYFKPKFLLGMSATPERTDDFNIYELFDYNIAYEIRLQQALEEDMLCPFHYFGVTDFIHEGKTIEDTSLLDQLVNSDRIDHILEKINYYGFSGDRVRGLIFCSRKDEAIKLSDMLNNENYKTVALTGENNQSERESCVNKLEAGELDYIITVDIFNEGIDIPSINQVVMLRQTQSSIIFIQQLGRGLRKHDTKEFVTIIDFIGNYKNNYLIPIALSGDKSLNKDNIRKNMNITSYISGVSTINFEKIAKEQIFKSINSSNNLASLKNLRHSYIELKNRLNRIPMLFDFILNDSVDPLSFLENYKIYPDFLVAVKEEIPLLTKYQKEVLRMLSAELLNGKRKHEIILLNELIKNESISYDYYIEKLKESNCSIDENTINSVKRVLDLSFFIENYKEKYGSKEIVLLNSSSDFVFHKDMRKSLNDNLFFKQSVDDIINTAFEKSKQYECNIPLTLYKKYSRKDVCKLLNWHKDESSVINGYKTKHNTCPIFITYHKDEHIDSSIKYSDEFLSASLLKWSSRKQRTLKSKEILEIINAKDNSINIYIFIKKEDAEGTDFYYLGRADVVSNSAVEDTMKNEQGKLIPVVHMNLMLEHEVKSEIYNHLTQNIKV